MQPKCAICSAFGLSIAIVVITLRNWSGSIKQTIPHQLLEWKIAEDFNEFQATMEFLCNKTFEENISNTSMLEFDNSLKLFTMQKKPIIWVYWNDFERMPPYIKLSIDTIKCHNYPNFHVQLLNASTVKNFVQNLHSAFRFMFEIHKSDYIRGR